MRDRSSKRYMPHTIAAYARQCYLNATLFTDDALVFHPLVLTAQAFIILDWTKNARKEQAVSLRLERAIIYGFWFFDLAKGPGENFLRARYGNLNLVKSLRRYDRVEEIHDLLLIHFLLLDAGKRSLRFLPVENLVASVSLKKLRDGMV